MRAICSKVFCAAAAITVLASGTVFGQSLVGRNTNAVGPTPDGFYKGLPHYQDNEADCDRNPLQESNIVCMANGYGGADDLIVASRNRPNGLRGEIILSLETFRPPLLQLVRRMTPSSGVL